MLRMSSRFSFFMLCVLVFGAAASAQTNLTAKAGNAPAVNAPVESDRSRDGLVGPVRRVRTEVAKLVMTDGRVGEAKVKQSSGFPRLDEAAIREVKRSWRLVPGTENGKPVPMWGQFAVTFKLTD